jgi:hypothetical protein
MTLSLIQQANAQYLDIDTGPKVEGTPDCHKGSDLDQVVYRIATVYAHQELDYIDLTTCWLPFKQVGPRERKSWSRARLGKALDAAMAQGLIEATTPNESRFRLTPKGRDYIPTWQLTENQGRLF